MMYNNIEYNYIDSIYDKYYQKILPRYKTDAVQ